MEAWAAYTGCWKLKISNVWWQQRFLHPLPPRDRAHAIAFSNRSSGKLDPQQQGVTSPNKKHSSLATMKQPISDIRRQYASSTSCFADKYSGGAEGCRDWRFSHNYINISLKSAVGGLTTIVPQTRRPVKARQPSLMHEWNIIFRSIHSTFPLLDNNPQRCHRFLDTELSYSFHPETPIRIPRRRIRDAPLPHAPRLILHHGNRNSAGVPRYAALSPSGTTGEFIISPWNHYMYESECHITCLWQQEALHERVFSRAPNKTQSTRKVVGHIAKKLSRVVKQPSWIVLSPEEILSPAEPSIHYARCGNHSMIALEAATSADKWKHYYPRFRRYYPSARAAPSGGGMDQSFEDCSASPCHISGTRPEIIKVRARMVSDPLITGGTPAEELLAMTPTTHSIGLFAKDRSCNTAGRPTSRSARTIIGGYDDVSNRSYRITASIRFCGCSNQRNGLYRMQHIPRSSCAKTSARKHGSTIRVVRDEYGPPGLFRSSPLSGRALLFTRVRRKRTNWYSDSTRFNFFAHLRGELFIPAASDQ
uniref:Maturase K n=1 Tax=Selaginella doederleinii TaxID=186426 RepID=A0A482CHN5_9TRAC|nr:maturase K [Selaginella doederleinii]QBL76022.1 maturase K [Selaginella doederleinii]